MALLEIRNITRRFGAFEAVKNISFAVKSGEFFTLLGPSGCGKTTILRKIAGFDLPDGGQILLDGHDLISTPAEKRPIHTVFQSYALFPHLTVGQNVAFPLRMAGVGGHLAAHPVFAGLLPGAGPDHGAGVLPVPGRFRRPGAVAQPRRQHA